MLKENCKKYIGSDCPVIIEDIETQSQEMQCDLLAGVPLQKFAKMPGATKIVYNTGNDEDDVRTAAASVDYCIMEGDHNTDVEGDHNTTRPAAWRVITLL